MSNTPTQSAKSPEDALVERLSAVMEQRLAPIEAAMKTKAGPGFTPPGMGSDKPATSEAKDLALDVEPGKEEAARWGWRVMGKYYERAVRMGFATPLDKEEPVEEPSLARLKARLKRMHTAAKAGYLAPVRKTGQYLSTFEDGGALWARETHSGEMILFLRESSAILSIPGLKTVSGYGTRLVLDKENTNPSAEWVGEGSSATASKLTTQNVILGAHKLMGRTPISNDIIRLGTGSAAAFVGDRLRNVMAEAVDDACVNGTGAGKPRGLYTATNTANKVAIAGTSAQNKVDDTLRLIKLVRQAFIPNAKRGTYLLGTTTFFHLAGLRGTDAYIFEGLRNMESPLLHGRPAMENTKFEDIGDSGAAVLGYVVGEHCTFGEASPMVVEVGENGSDFANDMQTVRGIAYADLVMHYDKAAAWLKNVSY